MEIIKKDISLCKKCNNYKGTVQEKYNGEVKVLCVCSLREERIKYGHWRSPCMLCPNGDKFCWVPASTHNEPNGKLWRTLYYCKEPLN